MPFDDSSPSVRLVRRVTLTTRTAVWHPPALDRSAIDAHWTQRLAAHPSFFNGIVYVLTDFSINGEAFSGSCAPIAFKTFLYWMDHGSPDAGFRDISGAAIVVSREHHLILGCNAGQTLSAGKASFFSGFIDARDVTADQRIDLDGNIARELAEETGLVATDIRRDPRYFVTFQGSVVSLGVAFLSRLSAPTLQRRISAHSLREDAAEIADVMIIKTPGELAQPDVRPHVTTMGMALLEKLARPSGHRTDEHIQRPSAVRSSRTV